MARLAPAAASFLVATFLTAAALAEEKPVPWVGSVVVPGGGGRVLSLIMRTFNRPPPMPPARLVGWLPVPPELPRATIATLYKLTF